MAAGTAGAKTATAAPAPAPAAAVQAFSLTGANGKPKTCAELAEGLKKKCARAASIPLTGGYVSGQYCADRTNSAIYFNTLAPWIADLGTGARALTTRLFNEYTKPAPAPVTPGLVTDYANSDSIELCYYQPSHLGKKMRPAKGVLKRTLLKSASTQITGAFKPSVWMQCASHRCSSVLNLAKSFMRFFTFGDAKM